jgi:hypothetical protein
VFEAGAVQGGLTTNRRVNRILNRLGKRTRATEEYWFKARLTRLNTFQRTLCQPRSKPLRCIRITKRNGNSYSVYTMIELKSSNLRKALLL